MLRGTVQPTAPRRKDQDTCQCIVATPTRLHQVNHVGMHTLADEGAAHSQTPSTSIVSSSNQTISSKAVRPNSRFHAFTFTLQRR